MNKNGTTPIDHILQVKSAFTDLDWYLSGYEANIRIRSETTQSLVRGKNFNKVVDLGCGDGSLSLPFLEEGATVTFFDLSDAMLGKVSARLSPKRRSQATFITGDFASADFPPGSFDLVIFVGVLAYIKDLDAAAKKIRQMIRPGGGLILEYTNASHIFGRLNFFYRDLTAHFRNPKCKTFRHKGRDVDFAFKNAGLVRQKSFHYSYTLPIILHNVTQSKRYKWMRTIFGSADEPRRQFLGSENIIFYGV